MSPERQHRLHWQRGEGMVLFTELCERLLPPLVEGIAPGHIEEALEAPTPGELHKRLDQAQNIGRLISDEFRFTDAYGDLIHDFGELLAASSYTYESQTADAFLEGLKTASAFPFHLMKAVDAVRSKDKLPPIYCELATVRDHLRAPWFHDVIHTAAFTANGFWGEASFDPARSLWESRFARQVLHFDFYESDGGDLRYRFTETAAQHLKESLQSRNRNFMTELAQSARCLSWPEPLDNYSGGTSSGCPVRHRLPLFRSDPSTSLEPLAELFNASPERLAAPREQSGIDIGLNALARLLDRALDIQELGRPSLADAGR